MSQRAGADRFASLHELHGKAPRFQVPVTAHPPAMLKAESVRQAVQLVSRSAGQNVWTKITKLVADRLAPGMLDGAAPGKRSAVQRQNEVKLRRCESK